MERSTATAITVASAGGRSLACDLLLQRGRFDVHPVLVYGLTVLGVGACSDDARLRDSAMGFDIPANCTLPTAAHPVRQAEFEALFATALSARRVGIYICD
jgi:hypothetical protein